MSDPRPLSELAVLMLAHDPDAGIEFLRRQNPDDVDPLLLSLRLVYERVQIMMLRDSDVFRRFKAPDPYPAVTKDTFVAVVGAANAKNKEGIDTVISPMGMADLSSLGSLCSKLRFNWDFQARKMTAGVIAAPDMR